MFGVSLLHVALLMPPSIQIAGEILSNTSFLGDDRWGGVWTLVELYKWGMKSRDYKGLIYGKAKCSFATHTLNFDTALFLYFEDPMKMEDAAAATESSVLW